MDLVDEEPRQWRRGIGLYLFSVFLISVNQAITKFMVEKLHTFVVMQIRMAVTTTICVSIIVMKNVQYPPEAIGFVITRGILGFLGLCCTYYGLQYLSLPDKAALAFLVPLATIIGAKITLKEQLTMPLILGSISSLLGILIIARPPIVFGVVIEEHRLKAVLASLIFIVVTASGTLILRRLRTIDPILPVFSFAAISLVVATTCTIAYSPSYPQHLSTWMLLAATGVLGFAIQYFEAMALRSCDASGLVNLRYTQIIWASLWEWLIWGDLPDIHTVIGSVVVIISVFYSTKARK